MKTAIITGITGQDGAYLAEYLINNNYDVIGTFRRTSTSNFWRIEELGISNSKHLTLVEYDLTDLASAYTIIKQYSPDEIYNLAAQSFVGVSFSQPIATANITGIGCLNLLEAIKTINPRIKFYQASTSEMFGKVIETPQTENTPFYPRSPYGVSKLFAHWTTINYRESYGIYASSGILFNHESPFRGKEFVTRKISDHVAKHYLGSNNVLELGNLNARRDWGYAKEYVEGMHKMLQQDKPSTYVLATNKTYSVRQFVEYAFNEINIELEWKGEDQMEIGLNKENGKTIVRVNDKYFRPCEVEILLGDASKANKELNWSPKMELRELTSIMVKKDIERNKIGQSF